MKTINKLICPALALLSVVATAHGAPNSQVTMNLEPQPMLAALNGWAEQTGLQIVVLEKAETNNLVTRAVKGSFTPRDALAELLAGTSLTYEFVSDWIVVIRPMPQQLRQVALTQAAEPTRRAAPRRSRQREATAATDESRLVEEVIVTAQKRTERLVETPQSVSVLSSEALVKIGATQFRDFANTVPGLNFQTGGVGFNQLSLRGVTTGYDITPSVGNVVDDVPYGSSSAFARGAQLALDVGLFDVQRVEVLKGPQGTLYGASTMGGLIKYVTKTPDAGRLSSELQVGVSNTTDGDLNYNGAAAVNIPLVADKVALRVSGYHSRDGGYIDNVALGQDDVNASRVSGGRLDLLAEPNDALTLRFSAVMQDIDRDGTATSDRALDGTPLYGDVEQFRLIPETFDQRFRLASATATYDMGAVELTSISSYQTLRSHFLVDDSPLLIPTMDVYFGRTYSALVIDNSVETDKFTQEVRLASDNSHPVQWLLGGFYTHETSENRQELLLLDGARQPAPNDLFHYRTPSKYQEYAAFGNVTYHFTEKFDITGGLRYARNEQEYTQDASGILVGALPKRSDSENVYTYLANARYRFTPDMMVYARFATGYRPGGPNSVPLDPLTGRPNAPESFKADTSKSYELGFKRQSATGLFGADVAVFYIDWKDLQQLTTTASGVSYYANAQAGAEIKGAELTLTSRPIAGLSAVGAFAYQDATMSDAEPILGARRGERLPNVPRFTAAVSADYVFDGSSFEPSLGMTFRSISDRMSSFDGNGTVAQYDLGSYSTFDVRAGFLLGATELQLYVRNVGDERGQLVIPSGVSSPVGPIAVSTLQPRTFGLTATMSF